MAYLTDFTPTENYPVSRLNQLTGAFIRCGCIGSDDLKPIKTEGGIIISQGRCILPDKSVITVDKGGHLIETNLADCYIFINDRLIQAGEMPHSPCEDFLLLGQLTEGILTDLRKRACIYHRKEVNR